MNRSPGLTREQEEQKLAEILLICKDKLETARADARALEDELHAMQQEFDESDKEQQVLWHNADARFQEMKQEILRAGQARKKPYFGRIEFADSVTGQQEGYYIGRSGISKDPAKPIVIDWRAPIASAYYEGSLGKVTYSVKGEGRYEIDLLRKRTYQIEDETLKDFYDSEVVANDDLLTKYLAKNKGAVLSEIIATIQAEQNEVIRKKPQHNMIIQGAAGSGKTTVAMHRISYILYNYDLEFKAEDFYVVGSNQVLLNYITGVLPELNVYGVRQMTMEQLFVRLLYEAWDTHKYGIKPIVIGETEPIKGTAEWFHDLTAYARKYEWSLIPMQDIVLEKNHVRLMSGDTIRSLLERFDKLSRADKITMLTERLLGKLENEICGKYYSYSEDEKKELRRKYARYFGRREWKGSIYEVYHGFLASQAQKGMIVKEPEYLFDIYDLAALAYLYKRLTETEIIREAGHVVIDEAQDFGMMAYHCLKYCLSTCTYTIMGDVSQNIYMDYGLNDWQQLRKLMLPEEFDYFGLLRKSYRNTVEIADFATGILKHGSFQVYPVQPIIRHGEAVKIISCEGNAGLLKSCQDVLEGFKEKRFETMAIICQDQKQADFVREALKDQFSLNEADQNNVQFEKGISILPLHLTKGLEFDAVIIYDCSREQYPTNDGQVKRLYVAATRALHELVVLYQGELSGLIADEISEGREQNVITESSKPTRKPMPKEEEKTKAEIAIERAKWGEIEMRERNYIGPKRIPITEQTKKPEGKANAVKKLHPERKNVISTAASVKIPSYLESQMSKGATGLKQEKDQMAAKNPHRETRKTQEFGSMPEQKELTVPGHAKAQHSILMCMKEPGAVTLISGYGSLYLESVSRDAVRICFQKGTQKQKTQAADRFTGQKVSWKSVKETKEAVELHLEEVMVKVSKKTGEISFWGKEKSGTEKEVLLLTENAAEPRFVTERGGYTFFSWKRKESLMANPPAGQLPLAIGQSAKMISFGEKEKDLPGIHSDQGYELWFPAGRRTTCCNISMYGPYLFQEGEGIEYYFVKNKKV